MGDGTSPPKSPKQNNGILSLGRQLYDQDKELRELIIFCAEGDIMLYNAYMKSSVEKALTLLEFNQERRRRELESIEKHGTDTNRIYGKRRGSKKQA